MELPVRKFKSMEVALKTLEPYVKSATQLQTGKPFQNFGDMRSREAVPNATINAVKQRQLSFTTTDDLIGGDGIIHDETSGEIFPTEHVMGMSWPPAKRGWPTMVRITARTYLAQYALNGQKWRVPLGACSAVSLAKAREAAAAIMGDVAKGRNPAADRKATAVAERAKRPRARLTLRVLIEDWNRLHLGEAAPKVCGRSHPGAVG